MADDQPGRVSFPTLVMTGGPLDGTEYPLPLTGKPIVLGSSMDADVQILLGNVEAAHAYVTFAGGELVLSDAGSATGTFINGENVESERALCDGDRICLGTPGAKGSAKLLLKLPSAAVAAGEPAPAPSQQPAPLRTPLVPDEGEAPALFEQGEAPALDGSATPLSRPSFPAEAGLELSGAGDTSGALFTSPLPPAPPQSPERSSPPAPSAGVYSAVGAAASTPHGSAPSRAAAPPAPAPAPPPPAPRAAAAPPPPPPPRAPAKAPEYHGDLPSLPATDQLDASGRGEFPALRPSGRKAAGKATGKGRPAARRRGLFGLPSLPVWPAAAALVLVALLGGAAWWMLFRAAPTRSPVSLGPLAGQAPAPGAAGSARGEATGVATALEPDVALPGQRVLLRGQAMAGKLTVLVAGMPATGLESTAGGVHAVIPDVGLPEGVKTALTVQSGSSPVRSFDLFIGRLPLVQGVQPENGPVGQMVTIRGRGFAAERQGNAVSFSGQPALVVSATPTELRAVVPPPPPGDVQPELALVVTAGSRTSSRGTTFQLSRGATSGFRPRFFAAPVVEYPNDDLAFVSTEIGPVLLLAGHGGGPAAAERALSAAAALNAVVDAAPGRQPVFEQRERPEPGVAIAGEPRVLLAPTPEDVAAYSRPWETGKGGGRRVSAAAVARHWTALLQDYLGLFLERQRPIQFVALSPHARVLSEIYAEAGRRSPGERTVPTSLVLPTPASMAAALRLMALLVSTDAPRAAVAVEGRWQGRIEDPDHGGQAFQAQLRSESGRLAGTLTTRAGSIEVRTPLREVGFERGSVRFTADLQGAPCRFKGTLDRNNVSGTVERTGKASRPFAMQFVE